jgi:shikimate 5-dehydrogenase
MSEISKCDYCGDKNIKTRPTPYMADIPAKMCKTCWDMAKEQGLKTEEVWIGEFENE